MAKSLSDNLRSRLIAAVNGGMSRRAAAERFGMAVATSIRWVRAHHHEALDRCVGRLQRFEASNRPDPLLQFPVVGLDDVVEVLDLSMQRRLRAFAFLRQLDYGMLAGRRLG